MRYGVYSFYGSDPTTPTTMKYRTVKAVGAALLHRGGWLEVIRDSELPEYAPHLSKDESGWPHGLWVRQELLEWAHDNL